MQVDSQTQAVLLLTLSFGKSGNAGAKPLSTKEWARFAIWLRDHNLKPSSLLKGTLDDSLSGWTDRTITLSRLENLLDRGALLGLLLEKWQRAGLWAIARSDPDYPDRLKRRLKFEAPPILFGCGNKMLLKKGGIAVVGSRDATEEDITYTNNLGAEAAAQGYSIVSGGARGVDQSAMLGALECEGTAVGILADSLLRSATSAKYRKYLMAGDLALVSPFNPEAGFNVGNAMARNRSIYCLADTAVVISSTPNKGGTWNGAIEDLEARWVPLWVKQSGGKGSGNPELVKRGGRCLPEDISSLNTLFDDSSANGAIASSSSPPPSPALLQAAVGAELAEPPVIEKPPPAVEQPTIPEELDLYGLFLHRLGELTASKTLNSTEISKRLNIKKTQTDAWLKRGVSEERIKKLNGPVRYQLWNRDQAQQSLLFLAQDQAKGVPVSSSDS